MMKTRRLSAMILLLAIALLLCACGKDKYTDGVQFGGTLSGEGGARLFSAELISLPQGGAVVRNAVQAGESILFCA